MYIEVKLIRSMYFGKGSETYIIADWPPSPQRLYSALICGYYLGLKNGFLKNPVKCKEALEWLERQLPPSLFFRGAISNKPSVSVMAPILSSCKITASFPIGPHRVPCVFPCAHLENPS